MNELATWLPHGVLGALFVAVCALLWRMLSHFAKDFLDNIKTIKAWMESISKELGKFATIEQLGRMGDRFDSRLADTNKELGAMGQRLTRVEAKLEDE